jgi:hypothetical protein
MMNHTNVRRRDHSGNRNNRLPQPTVYRMVCNGQYNDLLNHIKEFPQDVYWEDGDGRTALFFVCGAILWSASPSETTPALEAILAVDPRLIAKSDRASWTPLHVVCHKAALHETVAKLELVCRLVEACPEALSIRLNAEYCAKTPFHLACESEIDISALQAMLRVDPSLATQTCYQGSGGTHGGRCGETPLELVWKTQMRKPYESRSTLATTLPKMELLLRAAYFGTIAMDETTCGNARQRPFWLLPAVCSIRCPRDYASQMLSLHRQEMSVPDHRTGWLPLHYAILSAQEQDTTAYTSFLIERLLEECPNASMVPFRPGGNLLPLHVLVADRAMTWHNGGVQQLAWASHASVLIAPDPRSRLVPALESAIHAFKSRQHLSTTFELLRLAPQVLQEGFFSLSGH